MVGNDEVAWVYSPDHSNPPMTMWDIALGTVGALNEAAGDHPDQRFEEFIEHFMPDARAVCHYRATVLPSNLSKSILIRTLAAAAIWALNDGEFHDVDVQVLLNGREIAHGGFGDTYLL